MFTGQLWSMIPDMQPIKVESSMNKTESAFAQYLDLLQRAGEIIEYRFESIKFTLSRNIPGGRNAVTYTPDFMIVYEDYFEFVDIKARAEVKLVVNKSGKLRKKQWSSMRDDARCKINIAAELYPRFRWAVYYFERNRWIKEAIN